VRPSWLRPNEPPRQSSILLTMVAESNTKQILLQKRRRERVAMSVAGLLLLAGVFAAAVVFLPNRNAAPETVSTLPAQVPKTEAAVPLPAAARTVAGRFVLTAVARKNLAAAYDHVGPNLRGGLTRKEWLTGDIPVIPYPIQSLRLAPFKIDYSHKSDALIELALLPRKGAGVKSQIFYLTLKKIGPAGKEHWVVDGWVPKGSTFVPQGDG
jgi:hypothetical protein